VQQRGRTGDPEEPERETDPAFSLLPAEPAISKKFHLLQFLELSEYFSDHPGLL
jgi:hypothetical protein